MDVIRQGLRSVRSVRTSRSEEPRVVVFGARSSDGGEGCGFADGSGVPGAIDRSLETGVEP